MSDAEAKKTYFVIISESPMESWIRDGSTFVLFVGLIGIGILLESMVLQWVGAIIGFMVIIARANVLRRNLTKAEAIKFITEMPED